jgi:hypothetical protein
MNKDLEKKAEELQQTLSKQLEFFKVDSKGLLTIGGLVLVGALLTYAIVKTGNNKKHRDTDRAIEVLEREGLLTKEVEKKLNQSDKSSFWPSLSQRLLILGLAFAKEKLLPNLFNSAPENEATKDKSK